MKNLFAIFLVVIILSGQIAFGGEKYSKGNDDEWARLTPWSDWLSEENHSFGCPDDGYIAVIWCNGRYCDDKRFRCRTGYKKANAAPVYSGWKSEEDDTYMCPKGYFIDMVQCDGDYCDNVSVRCSKMEPIPRVEFGQCREMKGISEEGGRRDGYDVTGQPKEVGDNVAHASNNQLFGGFHCTGSYCDNLYMQWCDVVDGGIVPLNNFGWIRERSISGGTHTKSFTVGRNGSKESSHTFGVGVDVGVEQKVEAGVGVPGLGNAGSETTVSVHVTASYEHGTSSAEGWEHSATEDFNCDQTNGQGDNLSLYVFALQNKEAGVVNNSKRYRCHYSRTSADTMPMCLPDECDDILSVNCQKCTDENKPLATSIGPMVETKVAGPMVRGLFVEYLGQWAWTEKSGYSSGSSLILYNGKPAKQRQGVRIDEAADAYLTFCMESYCFDTAYTEDTLGRDEEQVVFSIPQIGYVRFVANASETQGGQFEAEFWESEEQSKRRAGNPLATGRFKQLIH